MNLIIDSSSPFILVLLFIATISSSDIFAQSGNVTESAEFIITFKRFNRNKIEMRCKEGCAWKKLKYNFSNNSESITVNEYGIANEQKSYSKKDKNLSPFMFKVELTDGRLKLVKIEGTIWTDLSFALYPTQAQSINASGMIDL